MGAVLERSGSIVYLITNRINGKGYVGQTRFSLDKRWKRHLAEARARKYNYAFYLAIRKYGESAFTREILETGSLGQEEINKAEARWIAQLNTRVPFGYNLRAGGGVGSELHEESKAKISRAAKGRLATLEARLHMSEAHIKRFKNPEVLERHRERLKKLFEDPSRSAKISESLIRRFKDPEVRARHKEKQLRLMKNPETRAKIGASSRQRFSDPQFMVRFREKMSSPEIIAKVSAGLLGRRVSAETRAKIAAAHLGSKQTPETRANMRIAQRLRRDQERDQRRKLDAA